MLFGAMAAYETGEHYGVTIRGDQDLITFVAKGHVEPLRFLAALNAYNRAMFPSGPWKLTVEELLAQCAYGWAVSPSGKPLTEWGRTWDSDHWLLTDRQTPQGEPVTVLSFEDRDMVDLAWMPRPDLEYDPVVIV